MRTVNHELTRRVAGFKILLIIYLVICLLNLILAIVIPPSNFQIINQGTMLLNLIWVLVFALFLQKLNDVNLQVFFHNCIIYVTNLLFHIRLFV